MEERQQTIRPTAVEQINFSVDAVLALLPDAETLSWDDRRGIIARYTSVLEGNFICWLTAAYISVRSREAYAVIENNLREEVRKNHPGMLRTFAIAAHAVPTDSDLLALNQDLLRVRMFVARLSGTPMILMMAFFKAFITRFTPYLADLATRQGSSEYEYTDVHSVTDVIHAQELLEAFDAEITVTRYRPPETKLMEGVEVLRTLIETIICPQSSVPRVSENTL
jgi:hypothetical protein